MTLSSTSLRDPLSLEALPSTSIRLAPLLHCSQGQSSSSPTPFLDAAPHPLPDAALAFDRQLYGLSGPSSLWPASWGKGLESSVREQQGVLTGSGILSVLGLLGRGTHASSSREIRKFPFCLRPATFTNMAAPRGRRGHGLKAHAHTWGLSEGTADGAADGRAETASSVSISAKGAGARGETSRLYKDGGRIRAVTAVPSRARRLSRAAPGRSPRSSAASSRPPESPRSAPCASLAPLRLPRPRPRRHVLGHSSALPPAAACRGAVWAGGGEKRDALWGRVPVAAAAALAGSRGGGGGRRAANPGAGAGGGWPGRDGRQRAG